MVNKKGKQEIIMQRLCINRSFISRIKDIRTKYVIPPNGIINKGTESRTDIENYRKWFRSLANNTELTKDIVGLLKEFNVSSLFYSAIRDFILFNNAPAPLYPIIVESKFNSKSGLAECFIQIFGDTQLRDIIDNWSQIEKIQSGKNAPDRLPLLGYTKQTKKVINTERDEQIRRWREDDKLSLKETYKKALESGYKIEITDIPNIIRRHKHIIGETKLGAKRKR